ncbi:hypothetical protein ACT7DN_00015 [Bacillus paranthracis]
MPCKAWFGEANEPRRARPNEIWYNVLDQIIGFSQSSCYADYQKGGLLVAHVEKYTKRRRTRIIDSLGQKNRKSFESRD